MEHASCPTKSGDRLSLPTVKQRALEIMAYGDEDPPMSDPDTLSLQEVKLETDARTALLIAIITPTLMNEEVERTLCCWTQAAAQDMQEPNLLEAYRDEGRELLGQLYGMQLNRMSTSPRMLSFLKQLDRYRTAYFERSPQAHDKDKNYESIQHLLDSGTGTLPQHVAHLLYGIDIVASVQRIPYIERARIALRSDHLLVSLSKLQLAELEHWVKLLNEHQEVDAAIVQVMHRPEGYTAFVNPKILRLIKGIPKDMQNDHAHRRHQGCVAAIAFPDTDNTISALWQLSTRALLRAGWWDLQPEILSGLVTGPDAEK